MLHLLYQSWRRVFGTRILAIRSSHEDWRISPRIGALGSITALTSFFYLCAISASKASRACRIFSASLLLLLLLGCLGHLFHQAPEEAFSLTAKRLVSVQVSPGRATLNIFDTVGLSVGQAFYSLFFDFCFQLLE